MEFKTTSQPVFVINDRIHCVETHQYSIFKDFIGEAIALANNGAKSCYIYSMTNSMDGKTVNLENRRVYIRRAYV